MIKFITMGMGLIPVCRWPVPVVIMKQDWS